MNRWIVGCLDAWAPGIERAIAQEAPAEFDVRFAPAGDKDAQARLIETSDFLLLAGFPANAELFARAKKLRMLHRWGIGVDSVDLEAAHAAKVAVCITAGANSVAVSEHALLLMLASLRRLSLVDRALRDGRWMFKEMRAQCQQLYGKTVGILGLGHIGRQVAKRLSGFDVSIVYYDPVRAPADVEAKLQARYLPLDDVLAQADILTLHFPGGGANRHFIAAPQFARMKPGSILVNTARGDIVHPGDLLAALTSGKLMGAGLDVFDVEPPAPDNPLLKLDNVVFSPHTAASVFDNVANVARHAFSNMMRMVQGQPIPAADTVVMPSTPRFP